MSGTLRRCVERARLAEAVKVAKHRAEEERGAARLASALAEETERLDRMNEAEPWRVVYLARQADPSEGRREYFNAVPSTVRLGAFVEQAPLAVLDRWDGTEEQAPDGTTHDAAAAWLAAHDPAAQEERESEHDARRSRVVARQEEERAWRSAHRLARLATPEEQARAVAHRRAATAERVRRHREREAARERQREHDAAEHRAHGDGTLAEHEAARASTGPREVSAALANAAEERR